MSTDDSARPEGASREGESSGASSAEVTETASSPTVQGRRDAVREKAEQVRAKQSRARVARRVALITGVTAAVAVVAVVVAWAIGGDANRPQLSPGAAEKDGFVVTSISTGAIAPAPAPAPEPSESAAAEGEASPSPSATETAPVEIHVYVDYLAPAAREWQLANATQLSSWVSEGAATLTYHPVSMLTAKSNGTKYSLRAASAAACVATYAPDSFYKFSSDLLSRQPAPDSDGFSDKELADIAQANGTDDPKKLRECIETEAFASWVKEATERAVAGSDGVALTGTSMVTVNGQTYMGNTSDPAEFSQFVLTTASGKAAKTPSPTPTPTATETPAP
ncbi:DsbA family protein [Microbacterium sp. bgisy203]|uniref:DsbA family protein n=1 Tax=Microbacterium sp. bgisy203 TaxID=3413799 RepID=UPI003D7364B2